MAKFAPPYIYKPTPNRKPASKRASSVDKPQWSKLSGATLSMARLAATGSGGNELGTRETGTVYDSNGNDDCDLPSIEQLLYSRLQKEGLATEDQYPKNSAFKVGDAAVERDGSLDGNGPALGDNLGGSLEGPIVLLGGDDSSASEAEVDDGGPRAERVPADEGLFDSPETATDSTTSAPPSNPDGWHDIDDFPETAQRLWLVEQEPSMSGPMRPRTSSSSRASSEPLHDHIGTADHCTDRARSEATISHPACPRSQPPDHLPTDRSAVDEHELALSARNSDIFNKEDRQRQDEKPDGEDYDNDNEGGRQPQQEVKEDVAAAPMTGKVDDTYLSTKKDESSGPAYHDPSPEPCQDKLGSHGDSCTDDEFSNAPKSDEDDGRPRVAKRKRKRPSSPNSGPMHKKRKHHLEQRSTHQHRPRSKPYRRSLKSHSPLVQGSKVVAVSSAEGRLPSPAPSAPQIMDTEMPSDRSNPGGSSSNLPVLTEVTFRPYSQHCCSFTAVVREGCDGHGVSFSQLTQLIESIGHVGKIDDFTIKPLQQHSFLLTGLSRHTSPRLSSSGTIMLTVVEANRVHNDAMRSQLRYGRAVDTAGAVAPRGSEPSSSDHDGDLSDSDPDSSSDDDGRSSKDEQGRPSTRKNIPWDPIDELRLLAYKKEDRSWNWIFRNFPGRTENAVLARWNIVRPGGRRAMGKAGATRLAEEKKPRGRPRKQT